MRILVITPEYPPHGAGGILKFYGLMTAAWSEAGSEVSVLVSSPYSSFEDYDDNGVKVRFVPLQDIAWHDAHLSHLAAAPLYRRWIAAGLAASDWLRRRLGEFDVVETTDFGLLFAPLVSIPDRPPLVVRLHGSIGQISEHEPPAPATELDLALARLTEAAVLPGVDALHAHSRTNAVEWQARLARDVTFVPAPLPLPQEAESLAPREFAGAVVGRIQSWKGPELLCRALTHLGTKMPVDLRIAWVGRDTASGPAGGSMSAWLSRTYPGIWGDRIVPVGIRTPAEVADLQRSAFALVPSLWDTFNYTLPEAMSRGAVTLASTAAGSSYLIEDGRNGFRFDPDDPKALADLLVETCSMPQADRRRVGAAARATVARELDPAAAATASLSAFAKLTSSRPAEAPKPWVRDFFQSKPDRVMEGGHLENVSIRRLATHLRTRLVRKIVR